MTFPLLVYDNEKEKLINPLLFVIKLPMPRHPSLSLRHRRFFPFLQIFKNRKSGHGFARIAFDTNYLGLDIDDRFIVTEDLQSNLASDRRRTSRLTSALASPTFSVKPSTLIVRPLSTSTHVALTGILAVMRWCNGVLYDEVA